VLLKKGGAGKERKVCIVDLDFQTGHVCDYLDIDPQLKIRDIAENPERLDNQLFEIFISRHSSGVHVFAAPRSKFQPWSLDLTALDKLFGMIAARYEYILVALPVTWFPWTAHVLAASGGIVVTGVNTIPGLRLISETLTAIRDAARDVNEIRVVINHSEHGFLGRVARSDHVKKVLGEEKVLFVRDDAIAIEAVNTGAPMAVANPGAKIVKQIGALAEFCVGLKKASAPGR
jgi:pilus assembly protein CpaE